MDKYTVDLDKVLNDFEYSEYSLESAKVNRNLQDEHPNSSFNSNHCSRNDTAVKHSINNVFHSLNEYLSSDITPKKRENVQKNLKTVNISTEPQSTSFALKTHHVESKKIIPQSSETYHLLVGPAFKNLSQDLDSEEHSNTFNNSLLDTIDTYSDNCAINSEEKNLNEKAEINFDSVSINVTNSNDNKCLLDETPEEENSLLCPQSVVESGLSTENNTNFSNFPSEEILVDLGSNDSCDRDVKVFNEEIILTENIIINNVNEESKQEENHKIDSEHSENVQKEFYSNDNYADGNEVNKEIESGCSNIEDGEGDDKTNILINKEQEGDSQSEEIRQPETEKIGFDNDVELDEENIEQYFQELEEELGIQDREEKNTHSDEGITTEINESSQSGFQDSELRTSKEIISEKECLEREVLEDENVVNELIIEENNKEESVEIDQEDKELPVEVEDKKTVLTNIQNLEINTEESSEHESLTDKINDTDISTVPNENNSLKTYETIKENETQTEELANVEKTEESSDNKPNDKNTSKLDEAVPDSSTNSEAQPVEDSEKNSRPQNLTLTEEVPETTRKISLIGEPGSTPYNNLYSTKDFGKSTLEGSGDHNNERALSPTYSDVSTDSVSSSSSEDTAEYNDAVSEVQNDTKMIPMEKVDASFQEIMQNNMVHTVETSRSDVTMNKDFKNNLKTGNLRSESGASTSGGQSEESAGVQVDRQDVEGACALEVSNCPSENQENIGRNEEQSVGETANAVIGVEWLGKQAPLWLPDNVAMSCLHCSMKFTVIKRRHHCRACGLVLCSKCCNLKYRLEYLNAEARVCQRCYEILDNEGNSNSESEVSPESSSPSRNLNATQDSLGQPNPNNPLEYCSTVPPTQQVDIAGASAVPSVMVPVGVLKRKGSNKGRSNKSVMFCDGIRPGSDLTILDTDFNYAENQKAEKSRKSPDKSIKSGRSLNMIDAETKSFIPNDERSLPPTVTIFKTDIKYSPCANNSSVVEMLKNEPLMFALQSNVFVHVKIINMDCCVSRIAWCFSTEGLINVGQDEIVILLEFIENESSVPKEIFVHLNYIYLEAVKGSSVKELGMSLHPSSPFLGSKNHSGFIFIRPTFQCLQNLIIPKETYLIGILIHRWETPWAKLFPLRLVLRLGAEYKYYPSPIISTRERDSVFVEIGHTIINLLADFRNFSYSLPQIRGLTIHMEDKNTTVTIPKNRYDQVLKVLLNSSDHILAFAGNFSSVADSHLVCIQDTQSATNNYSTHAINICNQPRKVTGASFIVFNGALKSTSGLTAKSNIVEDGLMIQILPEHMLQVRDSLKNMKNHTIKCGCINEESDETVTIFWGEPDATFNVGVLSPIDNTNLTGVPSMRVHNGKDYTCNSGNRLIRWTEVFISQKGEDSKNEESVDISKISENISKATCQALVKYLDLLVSNSFYKIGLRTHIHVENVSYLAGSNNVKLPPIYMKSLDNELIPVLHRIASNNVTEQPIVLELIFRILNI